MNGRTGIPPNTIYGSKRRCSDFMVMFIGHYSLEHSPQVELYSNTVYGVSTVQSIGSLFTCSLVLS